MASLPEFAAAVILAAVLAGKFSDTDGKELRPSDHGLVFQSSPPANSSPESMRSFFNADTSSSSSNSSSSSSADVSPFPEASNFTASMPPEWWSNGSSDGGRVQRLGGVLVVASLVCGVTGVALLVATGLIYLFNKHKRRKSQLNESFRCGDDDVVYNDDNSNENTSSNKLQLVPVPILRIS